MLTIEGSCIECSIEGGKGRTRYSLGILVFTSCKLDMWQCLVQLEMSIEIIWVKTFFPPVDLYSGVFYCFDQFDRVWLIVSGVLVEDDVDQGEAEFRSRGRIERKYGKTRSRRQ
jgi:hypothetical protein